MRLISEDDVFMVLSLYYHHRTVTQADALHEALEMVPEAVVRCDNCRYYDYTFSDSEASQESACDKSERWCCLLGLAGAFSNDDFCSHGERREDETD